MDLRPFELCLQKGAKGCHHKAQQVRGTCLPQKRMPCEFISSPCLPVASGFVSGETSGHWDQSAKRPLVGSFEPGPNDAALRAV